MGMEFQNIVDTLKTIIAQHQIQLLTESNKVRSFLADYIPNDAKFLRRISMFYESEASTIVRNNQIQNLHTDRLWQNTAIIQMPLKM